MASFRDRRQLPIPEVFFRADGEPNVIASSLTHESRKPSLESAGVLNNRRVCRDHYRLSLRVDRFAEATPGQFVHLCPAARDGEAYRTWSWDDVDASEVLHAGDVPMLRRAYSIAALRRAANAVEIDIIYRVVGKGTRWLETLQVGDDVSLLGPLGNAFPIRREKSQAWLVSGGVGLPPMLWLAEALHAARKSVTAFCGVQSADLLALTLRGDAPPDRTATRSAAAAEEFAAFDTGVVISTDDGSLGFRGHIGAALHAFAESNPPKTDDLVVYTCGPERMMRFVAEFCVARNIECHVCMERAMACGTGMCQSCVVPVREQADAVGWRYRLCCTDGPIFAAGDVLWERPA